MVSLRLTFSNVCIYFENNSQPTHAPTVFEHTRPDLCVIDYATTKCSIVEVSVPFDVFVNDCYQSQFNRYLPLCQAITEKSYDTKFTVLIVGPLGSVRLIGIPTSRAKRIAKYCSVSAMIGSRIIWNQRCKSRL